MIERVQKRDYLGASSRRSQCRKINKRGGLGRPLELYVMKGYFQSPVIKVDQGQYDIAGLLA